MKRPLYSSDANYGARQLKRLKEAKFPHRIQALPHVLKRIDLFSMTPEHAAVEAAASNDIDWLRTLLPQVMVQDKDHVGCAATDVAAAHGHHEAIRTIFKWWVKPGYKSQQMVKQALMNAVKGGHVGAVRVLLARWEEFDLDGDDWYFNHYGKHSPYDFDVMEALEEAVKREHKEIIRVICEKTEDPRKLFNWAAAHDNLQVFQCAYQLYGEDEMEDVFRAMFDAAGRGFLKIVKFVMEECGSDLAELYERGLLFVCPLATAIEEGKRDVVDYLYEINGYKDESLEHVLGVAAHAGSLELVEMFVGKHHFGAAALNRAFALAAHGGHLEIVKYLQSLQKFGQAAIDGALVSAVGGGQMEVLSYLCAIEGYKTSAAVLDEAFQNGAGSLQFDMLKHLDSKGSISRRAINTAFEYAAIAPGVLWERRDVQVRVLEFLLDKGGVSPEAIDTAFSDATLRCRLDVVELVYSRGSISPEAMNKAFQEAAKHNCAEVVRFLYQTDLVSSKSVEKAFLDAADRSDLYVMECLFSCGYNDTQTLLDKAWRKHSAKDLPRRVLRFLKQKELISQAYCNANP